MVNKVQKVTVEASYPGSGAMEPKVVKKSLLIWVKSLGGVPGKPPRREIRIPEIRKRKGIVRPGIEENVSENTA